MKAPRSQAINSLISELEAFKIDLNQYYDDLEPQSVYDRVLSGKLDALAHFCKALGWSDLCGQLEDLLPLHCTAVEALERVQGYVLPEVRHLMNQADIDSATNPTQLLDSSPSNFPQVQMAPELTVPEKVTIPWLLKHVPVTLWTAAVGLLIGAFICGVKASEITLIQEIFSLPKTAGALNTSVRQQAESFKVSGFGPYKLRRAPRGDVLVFFDGIAEPQDLFSISDDQLTLASNVKLSLFENIKVVYDY